MGIVLVINGKLIGLAKDAAIASPASFNTRGQVASGHDALLVFKITRISQTSCTAVSTRFKLYGRVAQSCGRVALLELK